MGIDPSLGEPGDLHLARRRREGREGLALGNIDYCTGGEGEGGGGEVGGGGRGKEKLQITTVFWGMNIRLVWQLY